MRPGPSGPGERPQGRPGVSAARCFNEARAERPGRVRQIGFHARDQGGLQ